MIFSNIIKNILIFFQYLGYVMENELENKLLIYFFKIY